jgi:hypothetical protein
MIKWPKRVLISLWLRWEDLFHILFHVKPIDPANHLLFSRVCTYLGSTIHLQDGEEIRRGDRVIELHFNNRILFQMVTETKSMVQLAVGMIRGVRQTLPLLTQQMAQHPSANDIKGVYGITFIHRGTQQLGFTVVHLQAGVFAHLTKLYLKVLLSVIHPGGRELLELKRESLAPRIVAISAKELRNRYSSD